MRKNRNTFEQMLELIDKTNTELMTLAREIYDRGAADHRDQTTEDPEEYLDETVARMTTIFGKFMRASLETKS